MLLSILSDKKEADVTEISYIRSKWLRGMDLNQWPPGYEPVFLIFITFGYVWESLVFSMRFGIIVLCRLVFCDAVLQLLFPKCSPNFEWASHWRRETLAWHSGCGDYNQLQENHTLPTKRDSPISGLSLVLYAFIRCAANRYIIRSSSSVALSSALMIACLMASMCSPPHAVTGWTCDAPKNRAWYVAPSPFVPQIREQPKSALLPWMTS